MTSFSPPPPTLVARAAPGAGSLLPGAIVAAVAAVVALATELLALYTDLFADLGRWSYVVIAAPYVVIAIGVFVLARTALGRIGGVVVLAAAAVVIGLTEWQLHVIRHAALGDSATTLRAIGWLSALVPPAIVVVGWGLGRRRGALWLVGAVATVVVAAVVHELDLHIIVRVSEHGLAAVRVFEIFVTLAAIGTVLVGTVIGWAMERVERPARPSAKQL